MLQYTDQTLGTGNRQIGIRDRRTSPTLRIFDLMSEYQIKKKKLTKINFQILHLTVRYDGHQAHGQLCRMKDHSDCYLHTYL